MNGFFPLALLVAAGLIVWLWLQTSALTQEVAKAQVERNRLSGRIQQEAMVQFHAWRQNEYDTLRRQEAQVAAREAQVRLAQWKAAAEATIRADAIRRSQSVTVGKVTEHVVPYLPDFSYNPKDARFVGSPVDFVVFDGLDEGAVTQVVFVEVKTGGSVLSKRERQIRDAVQSRRVRWEEIRVEPPAGASVTSGATGPTSAPADVAETATIFACSRCGAKNRVPLEIVRQRPATVCCGSCKTPLAA